jgi:HK97 family phage prohead protease
MPKILSEQEFRDTAKDGDVDGAQLRKAFVAEVKAAGGEEDRKVDFVISTDSVDRMGDTIAVDGWQLANFRKNPVILWCHDSSMMPVAKASNIRVEDGKLKATAEFMSRDISGFADAVFKAIKQGFLSAVSVGFAPVKYMFSEEPGRTFGIDFISQELLEFSVCPVPANPEALVEARAAGVDIGPIEDWAVKMFESKNLSLIPTDRLAAINALPDDLRADAKKASGSKGASGLYRRCANRVEKAINGDEPNEPVIEHIEPIIEPAAEPVAEIIEPPAEPVVEEATAEKATPLLDMARRRLALLG